MKLLYDLHLHSCLSPCGDMEMTPNNIVHMAKLLGYDVIAVSDHNTARNLPAVRAVAAQEDLLLIPAIEVTSAEEVHLLTLFYRFEDADRFSDFLYEHLPDVQNDPEIFGEQVIMDAEDEPVGRLDKLLINATDLTIDALCGVIGGYNGVLIPAHVDKNAYSILSNLGYIPKEYGFSCIEVKNPPFSCDFTGNVITNSDAHALEQMPEPAHALEAREKTIESVIEAVLKP